MFSASFGHFLQCLFIELPAFGNGIFEKRQFSRCRRLVQEESARYVSE